MRKRKIWCYSSRKQVQFSVHDLGCFKPACVGSYTLGLQGIHHRVRPTIDTLNPLLVSRDIGARVLWEDE